MLCCIEQSNFKIQMSKIFENEYGVYISHEEFINKIYSAINNVPTSYRLNPDLFKIYVPYKTSKVPSNLGQEPAEVQLKFNSFVKNKHTINFFDKGDDSHSSNDVAISAADSIQKNLQDLILDLVGANIGPTVLTTVNNSRFFFPRYAKFFSKDVFEMDRCLANKKFDFILLDPPWWNKYIRRKRKASSDGYKMMFNHDLRSLPIRTVLEEDGIVAVWCTNSEQNVNALLNDIFPHWGLHFTAKWYWVKVTRKCEPVCNFSEPPGKQPYEKLIFGHKNRSLPLPEDGKLLVSVPSAIHSHKPPLVDVLQEFLPENPKCLEIFARYLLPNWTSYGNEVLKLQHESLFVENMQF